MVGQTMQQVPLVRYVIAVTVVMAVILAIVWLWGSEEKFRTFAIFFAGFLLGMLAMFIAVHVYK
jgi:hypothetical protein